MVIHIFIRRSQETDTGRCLWAQGQLGQYSEFQDSQQAELWKDTLFHARYVSIYDMSR